MNDFEQYLKSKDKSAATISAYINDLRLFASWYNQQKSGAELEPGLVTGVDWRLYRDQLQLDKASAATVNRKLAALRAYVAYAIDTGKIDYDPLKDAKSNRRQATTAPRWLTKAEQNAVLREMERARSAARSIVERVAALRNQVMVIVMLNTGLRISELCDLGWWEVMIGERAGTVIVRSGKGNKTRHVPLNLNARKAITEWQNAISGKGEERIFPVTPRTVQTMLAEIGRRARVELTPHKLRHTFAKSLVDSGVSLDKVKELLGHDRLDTTAIYTRPGADDLEKAVDKLV